jgi:hypothetical protein
VTYGTTLPPRSANQLSGKNILAGKGFFVVGTRKNTLKRLN